MIKLAMVVAALLCLNANVAQADYVLDILHINDFHSRIEPINKFNSTCSQKDDAQGKCFGGVARLKTKLEERRTALGNNANVLFLSAGDEFQGSLYFSTYKGAASVQFLNLLKPDAMAVGNHELDYGAQTLSDFIEKAEFPVISGNISLVDEPLLADKLRGYIIIEKGGEKIAIISVVASELFSPRDKIVYSDPIDYLKSIVPEIESRGINKILLLSHIGLQEDKKVAASISGIDLIVGGHSHTLLSTRMEQASDVYPVMVTNPDGIKVPIVQAGAYSKYLGELNVRFDDKGIVTAVVGEPHLLDARVEPDAAFAAMVASLGNSIAQFNNTIVSNATARIEGDPKICRLAECAMGNLVTDAMLARVKAQNINIAILNSGSLRDSIGAGDITMGEVFGVLPFQNTLAAFQLSGTDIVASLENGVSQTAEAAGRFPQVAGLRFSWDETVEPVKGRIRQVQVLEGAKWRDIDPVKQYKVVANDFMRSGGDGYRLFKENGSDAYDFGPGLDEVLAEYLKQNNPYTPYTDGRMLEGKLFENAQAVSAEEVERLVEEGDDGEENKEPSLGGQEYVIQQDDTLWKIAKAKYGDATLWKKIEAANDVKTLRNLKIGDKIILP